MNDIGVIPEGSAPAGPAPATLGRVIGPDQ
jgi:hypothetical protein